MTLKVQREILKQVGGNEFAQDELLTETKDSPFGTTVETSAKDGKKQYYWSLFYSMSSGGGNSYLDH